MASNTVIQTNVLALNAHRNLGAVGIRKEKASQKLSSGYKINSAADDAAGLAISEKMRAQIRGLDGAAKNTQDAISLIQTAEGGMQTINDMVKRIRDLVEDAANDTKEATDTGDEYSWQDRQKIQDEIDSLIAGIDDIARDTEFNKKKLLSGDYADKAGEVTGYSYANIDEEDQDAFDLASTAEVDALAAKTAADAHLKDITSQYDAALEKLGDTPDLEEAHDAFKAAMAKLTDLFTEIKSYGTVTEDVTTAITDVLASLSDYIDNSSLAEAASALDDLVSNIENYTVASNDFYGLDLTSLSDSSSAAQLDYLKESVDNILNSPGFKKALEDLRAALGGGATEIDKGMVDTLSAQLADAQNVFDAASSTHATALATKESFGEEIIAGAGSKLYFQIGANENQGIKININGVNSKDLNKIGDGNGKALIDVRTASGSDITEFIRQIDGALSYVTTERSKLGAVQNRLEYTNDNLQIASENLSNAESRVRDTDMAKEMMNLTKANIIQQAATSMLAQANQAPQSVLSLLQ